jgi:hypothetical protein
LALPLASKAWIIPGSAETILRGFELRWCSVVVWSGTAWSK